MAFLSRSGQQEEFGSGGKILHGRRYLQQFSPYGRPSSSAAPLALLAPEPEAGGNPNWFRGLISGAGKLISSVLGSEGSGSPSEGSTDYSSGEESDPLPDEHDDHLLSDDLIGFNNQRESMVEGHVEPLAIVSKSESKFLIEQLLLQETFTREEYRKLMGVLQSRVVDFPSTKGAEVVQEEVPGRVSEKSPWQSLNQNWDISGSSNISPSNPSAFPPRYYVSESVTPDLRNRAVKEAKKWFEEKKLSPSPICDQECGPCVLNTDMNKYCFDSDSGSPVELAKSYMQSLPPWRSPSFSTTGFKHPYSNEKQTSCSVGSYLLLSSKVKKRDYSAVGSFQSSRVPLKSIADERGVSNLDQAGSATGPPLFEVSRTSPATTNFSNKVQDERPRLHDREAVKVSHLLDMPKEISQGSLAEHQEMHKISSESFNEQLHSDINNTLTCNYDKSMSDKNKDVDISAPHDSLMFSMADGNDVITGDSFPEAETFQPENVISAEPSIWRSKKDALQVNPDSDFKCKTPFTDSQPPDCNPQIMKETIGTADETTANGHLEEMNYTSSGLGSMSKGGPATTNSSNGCDAVAANVSERTHQPPSDVSSEIPSTRGTSSSASKPLSGAKIKSAERIHAEPSQPGVGRRRAKKVVRQKKWKG